MTAGAKSNRIVRPFFRPFVHPFQIVHPSVTHWFCWRQMHTAELWLRAKLLLGASVFYKQILKIVLYVDAEK